MDRFSRLHSLLACALGATLVIGTAPSSPAATIYQDESQGSAVSAGWTATSIWNPNGAASSGNDYINPATYVIRTPEAGNSTFAGDSLTIRGTLALKSSNDKSYTNTVNDLRLDGAMISAFTSGAGRTQTLNGKITVLSDSTLSPGNASEDRHFNFGAQVTGSAQLIINSSNNTSIATIANSANTFSGTWKMVKGKLVFSNAGAVGNGDVWITGGTLQIQGNWNAPASLNVAGGTIAVDTYNWIVDALSIGANNLSNGTYTVAQLNTYGTGTFTGTTGTIEVIPEPASLGVLGLAALALVACRRH